ncbi:unnamed protein product, partial [Wuchereria bancrofti]
MSSTIDIFFDPYHLVPFLLRKCFYPTKDPRRLQKSIRGNIRESEQPCIHVLGNIYKRSLKKQPNCGIPAVSPSYGKCFVTVGTISISVITFDLFWTCRDIFVGRYAEPVARHHNVGRDIDDGEGEEEYEEEEGVRDH